MDRRGPRHRPRAVHRLERRRRPPAGPPADELLATVRERLADDLDAPGAVAAVDAWVAAGDGDDSGSPALVRDLVTALLGVELA